MSGILEFLKRLVRRENFPVLFLIVLNLCVGLAVYRDYGEGRDTRAQYEYGQNSLMAYLGRYPIGELSRDDKGPSYAMLAVLGSEAMTALVSQLHPMQAFHYMNFLAYLLGMFFLYRLSRRLAGRLAAFGAVLLYNTQPLLWGHAFINPKDLAFMSFFLAAVEMGLQMQASPALQAGPGISIRRRLVLALKDWRVWLAALFLGLAAAMRVLGPVAGLMAGGWLFLKNGWRSLPLVGVYFVLSELVTILTWPGLWANPLRIYLRTFQLAAGFPWEGKILFAGMEYDPSALPRTYLPALVGLQFTEPLLALALIGMGLAAWRVWHRRLDWRLAGLLAAWFWAPLLAVMLLHPVIYDNFRQFLFIMPPLFVFAALSLQALFDWLRRPVWAALALFILVLPGVWYLVQLHPYQYIYYNSLAGGPAGAFRRYENDYWLTSYQEAVQYVNETAPQGAKIVAWGAPHLVKRYNRSDLEVIDYRRLKKDAPPPAGYAVVSSRLNKDQNLYPGAPVLFRVERGGVILAVVLELQQSGAGSP